MLISLKKTLMAGGIAAALGGLVSGGASAQNWDMPTPYPDATFHTANIAQFAKEVEQATGGKLKITVHSAGSLFKHPEIKNAVRSGQVPIGEVFMSLLTNENPAFGLDSVPFLAVSYDDARKLWEAQKPTIDALLDKQGLQALYAVAWPPQGLYSKREINTLADMKGLKFRSYNAVLERFATLAGAAPTQVEVPDLPQAFSTGRVEAMITSPSTGVTSKAWDYVQHYYDIQAWVPKNIVVVNKRAFRGLDAATQKAVLAAAATAEKRGWEMSVDETTKMTQALKDNGITVHQPSKELMIDLQKIGSTLLNEWRKTSGAEGEKILDAYLK